MLETRFEVWYVLPRNVVPRAAPTASTRRKPVSREATFPAVIDAVDRSSPPYWRANHVQKQLWCSSFHLSEDNLPLYVDEIRKRGIRFLEGYPSTMYIIASFLRRRPAESAGSTGPG